MSECTIYLSNQKYNNEMPSSDSARIPDKDVEAWKGFQTRELNNGRAAMFGIMGELAHSGLTGKGPIQLFFEAHNWQ